MENASNDEFKLETIVPGDGVNYPAQGQTVRVHYVGKFRDGIVFDSSRSRSRPFEFKLGAGQVIAGWDEGVKMMTRGQKAKVTIPPMMGYGEHGYPPIIPPNATLFFEIELLSFA